MDVDIKPGENFETRIQTAVQNCSIFLPVIGKTWLSAQHDGGRRRLDDPGDYVRLEISAALQCLASSDHDHIVVPILVGGAAMPSENDLPIELRPMALINAIFLRDGSYDSDFSKVRDLFDEAGFMSAEFGMIGVQKRLIVNAKNARGEIRFYYGWRTILALTALALLAGVVVAKLFPFIAR